MGISDIKVLGDGESGGQICSCKNSWVRDRTEYFGNLKMQDTGATQPSFIGTIGVKEKWKSEEIFSCHRTRSHENNI